MQPDNSQHTQKLPLETISGPVNLLTFSTNKISVSTSDISSVGSENNKYRFIFVLVSSLILFFIYSSTMMFWGMQEYGESTFDFYFSRLSRGQNLISTLILVYVFLVGSLSPKKLMIVNMKSGQQFKAIVKNNLENKINEINSFISK